MPEFMRIHIDGVPHTVASGTSVAAALWNAGIRDLGYSVSGRPRVPLCGMGTCFECRVTIDDQPDRRSCQTPCHEGMQVRTEHAP